LERYVLARPELRHVRTRKKSPHTNGVVERFNSTMKYEGLPRRSLPLHPPRAAELHDVQFADRVARIDPAHRQTGLLERPARETVLGVIHAEHRKETITALPR